MDKSERFKIHYESFALGPDRNELLLLALCAEYNRMVADYANFKRDVMLYTNVASASEVHEVGDRVRLCMSNFDTVVEAIGWSNQMPTYYCRNKDGVLKFTFANGLVRLNYRCESMPGVLKITEDG